MEEKFLGIVENGVFKALSRDKSIVPYRFTAIQMQEARPPESGELRLSEYEGKVVMITGSGSGGGWVYSAEVIDSGGPIVRMLAEQLSQRSETSRK